LSIGKTNPPPNEGVYGGNAGLLAAKCFSAIDLSRNDPFLEPLEHFRNYPPFGEIPTNTRLTDAMLFE
jgi:hypothetical protein